MFRRDIEEIKKDRRKLSKIQRKVKSHIYSLSASINQSFEDHWNQNFKNISYLATVSADIGSLTENWNPCIYLVTVDDDLLNENAPGKVSVDQVRKFGREFTARTGVQIEIRYIPLGRKDPIAYLTPDECEEEAEL